VLLTFAADEGRPIAVDACLANAPEARVRAILEKQLSEMKVAT
jgi:hypothetical protein